MNSMSMRSEVACAVLLAALLGCGPGVETVASNGNGSGGANVGGAGGAAGCEAEGCGAVRWAWQVDDHGRGARVQAAASTNDGGVVALTRVQQPVDVGFGLMGNPDALYGQLLIVEVDPSDGAPRAAQVATDRFDLFFANVAAGRDGTRLLLVPYFTDVTIDGHQHTTPVAPYFGQNAEFLPGYQGGIYRGKMLVASLDEQLKVKWSLSFGDERYPPAELDVEDSLGGLGPYATTSASDAVFADDGSALLVGTFAGMISAGPLELTRRGARDGFLMRVSASGEPLWLRGYGGRGASVIPRSAIGRSDGGLVMAGGLAGEVDFGAVQLRTDVPSDPWLFDPGFVAACDANGEVLWGHSLSGSPSGGPQLLADDGVWLAVQFEGELRVDGALHIAVAGRGLAGVELAADGTLRGTRLLFEGADLTESWALRGADGTVFVSATNWVREPSAGRLQFGALDADGSWRWQYEADAGFNDFATGLRPSLLHDGDPIWIGSVGPSFEIDGQTFAGTPDDSYPQHGQDLLMLKLAR
jgi:hypothetical protein